MRENVKTFENEKKKEKQYATLKYSPSSPKVPPRKKRNKADSRS